MLEADYVTLRKCWLLAERWEKGRRFYMVYALQDIKN